VGEDTRWVWAQTSIHAIPDPAWFAALVHPRNTSRKQVRGSRWHPIPLAPVQAAMGASWEFYAGLARQPAGAR